MKKTLIVILIILLLTTMMLMLFKSLHIGGLHILGVRELNNENKKLDSSIQNLSKLSSVIYDETLKGISKSAKEYEEAKNNYEQLVSVSTSNEVVTANQLQKYEIEYLWAKIGKHATDEDVLLKIDVAENSTSSATGYYDLNFTAQGSYVGITDFIYDIENDSSLGFKIEKFKMTSIDDGQNKDNQNNQNEKTNSIAETNNKGDIIATFTCSNIAINIDSSMIVRPDSNSDDNANDANNTNTSGDTNATSTNTSNSTN